MSCYVICLYVIMRKMPENPVNKGTFKNLKRKVLIYRYKKKEPV